MSPSFDMTPSLCGLVPKYSEANPNHEPAGSPIGGQFASGAGGVVDSPAFQAWFGDSRVVDANGKPLVVYHGTNANPESFRPETHFGSADAANARATDLEDFSRDVVHRDTGAFQILPVYLRIENPLRMPDMAALNSWTYEPIGTLDAATASREELEGEEFASSWEGEENVSSYLLHAGIINIDEFEEHRNSPFDLLRQKGYDGIVYSNVVEDPGKDSWIVFSPTQVKSAIGNKGTFDPKNPKISEALREASGSSSFDDDEVSDVLSALLDPGDLNHETVQLLANELGLPSEAVTIQIDRALDTKVWNGADFADRTLHSASIVARNLVTEMERSLMQQENYSEFSERMLAHVGVDKPRATGVLGGLIRQLEGEARLAWNEATISAHQGGDTALVWESVLGPTTTPECWAAHGELLMDLSISIPAHWGCFSSDTDVLTDKGFRRFAQLDGSEHFLSLNPKTHVMEWVHATRHLRRHHAGEMVHIKSSRVDLLVTSNHAIVYASEGQRRLGVVELQTREAADLLNRTTHIPRSGMWRGASPQWLEVAGEKYDASLFMEFFGWFLAEGNVDYRPNQWRINISQWKEPHLESIRRLCAQLFGTESKAKNCVYIGKHQKLAQWLHALGKQPVRYVPPSLKELSPYLLTKLLDAFQRGDGTESDPRIAGERNGGRWAADWKPYRSLYTSSPRLADDLAELTLKCGEVPSMSPEWGAHMMRRGQLKQFRNGIYPINHPAIQIGRLRQSWYVVKPEHVKTVDYDGEVFCVELEKFHTLYVRRNGKCIWAGNCLCMPRTIPNPDSPDLATAEAGQAIQEEMRADRDGG